MTAGTRRTWTPQEDATMLDWREDGMLLNEIAARLGTNRTSISSRRPAAAATQPLALGASSTHSPQQARRPQVPGLRLPLRQRACRQPSLRPLQAGRQARQRWLTGIGEASCGKC